MNPTTNPKINAVLSLINESLLLDYLTTIVNYAPRTDGTYGCKLTANYIHTQFQEEGLNTRYQNWTARGNRFHPYIYHCQNIEGALPGTDSSDDSSIIFNAHYDGVKYGPGANDDGSGTAAVLAAAYALSQFHFNRTLKFVTFAGEEIGLLGSQAYTKEAYERNDNIMLEINADMIGHDNGSRTMRVIGTEDAGWVADIFQTMVSNYSIGLTINQGSTNRVGHKMTGSDYAPFLEYGWESVSCWETAGDPNMHTAQDNLSNIDFSYLVNTTRAIAGALAYLADLPTTPPQVRITSPRVGSLYLRDIQRRDLKNFKTIAFDYLWIWAEVYGGSAPIVKAEFYDNSKLVSTTTQAPFKWHLNTRSLGNHEIMVKVYDQQGRTSTDWRELRFINLFLNNR
jgi:aminopeptidase YwaD